ncbi:MAG TPA: uracil-DNA glycosylase [Candidatus Binataceae bacterium]|nr:uracil-DNA glycosylase [Candidatus Binataceae bacterium]
MSSSASPPDRPTILASLRDYVEQLREEGLEGLPASAQAAAPASAIAAASGAPSTLRARAAVYAAGPRGTSITAAVASASASSASPAPERASPAAAAGSPTAAPADLFYLYPGLEKTADLPALREFIGECTRCKLAPLRTNIVFGTGNPHAELMFVGEAPGADEDARGEPFVGRAGQLLTDIIERGMGLTRAEVYICNVIKCRPPENRNPEPDEVAACEPFLLRQIDLVRPRAIVGLGSFAVQALLKLKTPISKLRGNWHEVRGIKMMPTFHPAYLLRNPSEKRAVWADIQEVMRLLGRPIPNRGAQR